MPVFAVRVVKREDFEGRSREFGNTYHFKTAPAQLFADQGVAEYLRALERPITSSQIDFVRWETWGPTDGTDFENVMRERQAYAQVMPGMGLDAVDMYREVCAVVAWPLPRSPETNRRRWCRKFIRSPGVDTTQLGSGVYSGKAVIPQILKDRLITYGNSVRLLNGSWGTMPLCTESGVEVIGDPLPRDYLKTREIGR